MHALPHDVFLPLLTYFTLPHLRYRHKKGTPVTEEGCRLNRFAPALNRKCSGLEMFPGATEDPNPVTRSRSLGPLHGF